MAHTTAIVCPGQGSQRHGMLDAMPDPDHVGRLLDAAEALSSLDDWYLSESWMISVRVRIRKKDRQTMKTSNLFIVFLIYVPPSVRQRSH